MDLPSGVLMKHRMEKPGGEVGIMKTEGKCAQCMVKKKICQSTEGMSPAFCSTQLYPEVMEKAAEEYRKKDNLKFAYNASLQEAECYIDRGVDPFYKYPVKPRVQEIIEFSRKMGYKKLGVAFCGGLHNEAAVFCKILEDHGFEVVSVMCKVGGIDKSVLGLVGAHERLQAGRQESMCNPIAQAKVLNAAETDFNILVGLCVGHDSLFLKYSSAMATVFAVKDRVMGHNPLAAIYTYDSYCERFKQDRLKKIGVQEE
jgi:uncharacterized metal-binding protein